MHSQEFIEEMKALLLERKAKYETEVEEYAAPVDMGDGVDEASEEVQINDLHTALRSQATQELMMIEDALARIDAGNYGVDENGVDINEDRLRLVPWATTSV